MKQATKAWLILAAALIFIGIAVFCCAMTLSGWDFSAFGRADYGTAAVDIAESFRDISIRSDTEDIAFLPSEDGKCRVVFLEREKERHTASVQGGTLSIRSEDTRKWYDRLTLFSFGTPRITVYLPLGGYASLSIEESTGDIVIPGNFTFERMDISASTGDVDCRASASGPIRIGTGTGSIRIENSSAGELALSVSTGSVEVRSADIEGDLGVIVSTGETCVSDVSCGSFSSVGNTGEITLEDVNAKGEIAIERTTGGVTLKRCDAAELAIRTDTGDVKGSLLSEKVFIARSDTGRIEVPETVSGGKCKITTDTGDILFSIG